MPDRNLDEKIDGRAPAFLGQVPPTESLDTCHLVGRPRQPAAASMPRPLQFEVGLDGGSLELSPLPEEAAPACASLECFGGLVRNRASAAATVVLAMTNAGFAPFWHNLRCSLERVNVSQHAIVIGTDAAACEAASSGSVPCVVGDQVLWNQDASDANAGHGGGSSALSQEAEKHGTVAYARLMHIKAMPALAVLRMGYNLLFTDTDMVWLRNPLDRLRATYGAALDRGELDVLIQSDYDESNDARCEAHEHCARSAWCDRASGRCEDEACGGFYYLRSAPPAIALLEALFERMAWQRKNVDARIGEQPALNYVLRRTRGLRYVVLPREQYPNGQSYFVQRPPSSKRRKERPVIVHNNWIAGFEAKRERFESHGLWFLGAGGACMAAAIPPAQRLGRR